MDSIGYQTIASNIWVGSSNYDSTRQYSIEGQWAVDSNGLMGMRAVDANYLYGMTVCRGLMAESALFTSNTGFLMDVVSEQRVLGNQLIATGGLLQTEYFTTNAYFDNASLIVNGSALIYDSVDVMQNIRTSNMYTQSVNPFSTIISMYATYKNVSSNVALFGWDGITNELNISNNSVGTLKIKYDPGSYGQLRYNGVDYPLLTDGGRITVPGITTASPTIIYSGTGGCVASNVMAWWKSDIVAYDNDGYLIHNGNHDYNTLLNKPLYVANGNVGIGTTAPEALLHVNGTFKANSVVCNGLQTNGLILTGIPNNDPSQIAFYSNQWSQHGDVLYLSAGLSNVGIGTSTPTANLDVCGSIIGTSIACRGQLTCGNLSTGGLILTGVASISQDRITYYNSQWRQKGTVLYLDAGSNVGLGTSTPRATLDVEGSVRASSFSACGIILSGEPGTIPLKPFSLACNLMWTTDTQYVPWEAISGIPNTFSVSYNDLSNKPALFNGAYSNLTGTPALFNGYASNLTFTSNSIPYTSLSGVPLSTTAISTSLFLNNGTSVYVGSGSNVGIGTASPTVALQVAGALTTSSSITCGAGLSVASAITANGGINGPLTILGSCAVGTNLTASGNISTTGSIVADGQMSVGGTVTMRDINNTFGTLQWANQSVGVSCHNNGAGWIGAAFGSSAAWDTSGYRVVAGYLQGGALIGAMNYNLSGWANLEVANIFTVSISDSNAKQNITAADTNICYDTIKALPLSRFNYDSNIVPELITKDRTITGIIAQDLQIHFPKSVKVLDTGNSNIYPNDGLLAINLDQVNYTMIGAVQQLMSVVEALTARIAALEAA
jgi:hypothetical protein